MNFWEEILQRIERGEKIALLYVLESIGSSPGRQGFKMFVSSNGEMYGSIGGGFMEHKIIELAKSLLVKGEFQPFLKKQIHKEGIGENRSGMICSGEQTIAFYYLDQSHIDLIDSLKVGNGSAILTESGIKISEGDNTSVSIESEGKWSYSESLIQKEKIYIIGGGHVSKALSRTMNQLGFHVIVLDDRENLNTMKQNEYAHEKMVVDYETIEEHIPEGGHYVVLMSFGYRTDIVCIKRLFGGKYKYLGMLGSQEKVRKMFEQLVVEGYDQNSLKNIYAPIGVPIHSKTPEEIAISVAAEIIKVKNG